MIAKIEALNDWGAYKSGGIDINELSLPAAQHLLKRFKNDWGCGNRKAKKDKKDALKQLQKHIREVQKK